MRGDLFSNDIYAIFDDLNFLIETAVASGELHDGKIMLVIAGSAPLICNNWIPYGTDDVDYIECSSSWLEKKLSDYDLNSRIQAYGDSWTYNYEDRLVPLFDSKYLTVYSMCLEDLIFMKLVRWSENDIEDIGALISNEIDIDFDFLDYLIYDKEEARGAGMSDRTYDELLHAYSDFRPRLENDDWIA